MDRDDQNGRTARDPRAHGKAPVTHPVAKLTLIKCADCLHCKQYREVQPGGLGRYFLKATCAAGHWTRGKQDISVHIHRLMGRSRHKCIDYVSTSDSPGERLAFLRALKESLPLEAHLYEPDGSFVDKIEQYAPCLHNAT